MNRFMAIIAFIVLLFVNSIISNAQSEKVSRKNHNGIVVATWNIGHFAQGKIDHSLISTSECRKKIEQYRSFVYDSIHADILCLNEFSNELCKDYLGNRVYAEAQIFNGFRFRKVFKQNRFVCNSLFSNKKLKSVKMFPFLYNMSAKNDRPSILWHYYVMAEVKIGGKSVKLILTHLVNRAEKHCQNQIKELIEVCKKYDKVIICGDMNTWDFSKFKRAGYQLANDGSIVTFPSKSYALDNIFVKGLKISEVSVHKTKLSDHYSLSCRVSL